jgi:acyl-coenzyme A thioesterase PaaI-like protein
LFDQFLGVSQKMTGQPGVTGTLTTRFIRPTPLCTDLKLIGKVREVKGRKNFLSGEIWAGDTLTASCEGLFIHISPERFRSLLGE